MLCGRVAIIREGRIVNVEAIETLRKKQLKKIRIEFVDRIPEILTGMPGMKNGVNVSGKAMEFIWSGDMNGLIAALSGKEIADMTVEEPSLEEIFMHYYN